MLHLWVPVHPNTACAYVRSAKTHGARLAGRGPSPPNPARLRPWLALLLRLPAPSRSLCRAARAAVEGLEEGLVHRAVEPPAEPPLPAASAVDVPGVLVEDIGACS